MYNKRKGSTHSFLFFGPGFPLTLTTPSTAKLALFFPPFPFPPGVPAPASPPAGGGIATESSVPLGTGVFPFDVASPSASGDAVGALESERDEVDEDAGGLSSAAVVASLLTSGAAGANFARREGESFSWMMRDLGFLDRPPPPLGVEGVALCALAMVFVWVRVAFGGEVGGGKPRWVGEFFVRVVRWGMWRGVVQ